MLLNEHGIYYTFDEPSEDDGWPMARMVYEAIHLPTMTRHLRSVRVESPGRFGKLLAIWNDKAPDLWRFSPVKEE